MKHKDGTYRDWKNTVLTEEYAANFLMMARIPCDKWVCPSCFDPRESRLCESQKMIPYGDAPETIFCPHCDFDIALKVIPQQKEAEMPEDEEYVQIRWEEFKAWKENSIRHNGFGKNPLVYGKKEGKRKVFFGFGLFTPERPKQEDENEIG